MPPEKMSRQDYTNTFQGEQRKRALKTALEIRSFEIDLYWKRAIYFWTFIGLAFGAYFLYTEKSTDPSPDVVYAICCVGLTFSFVWYLVNRGSKFWTSNWESHVDFLENAEMGPLYKTVLDKEHFHFWDLQKAYPFSVGKLNQILNLYICFIWIFLGARTVSPLKDSKGDVLLIILSTGTLFTLAACIVWGKTDFVGRTTFRFVRRKLKDGDAIRSEAGPDIPSSADEGQQGI